MNDARAILAGDRLGILGERVPARWYILRTPPMAERRAKRWLELAQVGEAWFPTLPRFHRLPAVRSTSRRKVRTDKLVAPGYVFLRVERAIRWDRLRAEVEHVSGVVSVDGEPYAVSDMQIASMAQTPARLEELHRRVVEAARAERLARVVRPGDRAKVCEGALTGWTVDVTEVQGDMAVALVSMMLGGRQREVHLDVAVLERMMEKATA